MKWLANQSFEIRIMISEIVLNQYPAIMSSDIMSEEHFTYDEDNVDDSENWFSISPAILHDKHKKMMKNVHVCYDHE